MFRNYKTRSNHLQAALKLYHNFGIRRNTGKHLPASFLLFDDHSPGMLIRIVIESAAFFKQAK
jgi:hypothetical protein